MTDETLKQHNDAVLNAIAELSKKIDDVNSRLDIFEHSTNSQFEAIRKGISDNYYILERVQGDIHYLRADVHRMSEQMREDKLALK